MQGVLISLKRLLDKTLYTLTLHYYGYHLFAGRTSEHFQLFWKARGLWVQLPLEIDAFSHRVTWWSSWGVLAIFIYSIILKLKISKFTETLPRVHGRFYYGLLLFSS